MKTGKEVGRLKNLGNSIDALAVDGSVYFGVNGQGIYRSDLGLGKPTKMKKPYVVSALTLRKGKLFAFYFSNGNDPFLDDSPAGGLVEILDENLSVISKRNGTPYAITQALNTQKGIRFSTRDTSNGWIEGGEGQLYSLNHSNLSDNLLLDFPAAVNILREGREGIILAGLKNGIVYAIDGKRKRPVFSQEYEVAGIATEGRNIYVGSPNGEINRVKY